MKSQYRPNKFLGECWTMKMNNNYLSFWQSNSKSPTVDTWAPSLSLNHSRVGGETCVPQITCSVSCQ